MWQFKRSKYFTKVEVKGSSNSTGYIIHLPFKCAIWIFTYQTKYLYSFLKRRRTFKKRWVIWVVKNRTNYWFTITDKLYL
jgi:hypothetical protein